MQNEGAVSARVNLTELLENSRVGALQVRVFVLCMACLIMDGFDVQAMGYTAPAVLAEWGGVVVTVPYLAGRSTTSLVSQMAAGHVG